MDIIKIKDITERFNGQEKCVIAQVKKINQTSGPTVFLLGDDSGTIKATGFISPGERAFPEIEVNKSYQFIATVRTRRGVEIEIKSFDLVENEAFSEPNLHKKSFLIPSTSLEKLRPDMITAVEKIKEAIHEERPIWIRHHDDTDGYSSGYVLEKAIQPLLLNEKAFSRISSRTPYYDYIDAMKDLNSYFFQKERMNSLPPLIILTDLGSNDQSITAIKRLKGYGIEFIIIDHHAYDEGVRQKN